MKSPGSKRSTPRSAKKQQSILSFFGSNGSRSQPPNPTIQKTVNSLALNTKPNSLSSTPSRHSPSQALTETTPLKSQTPTNEKETPNKNSDRTAPITRRRAYPPSNPSQLRRQLFDFDNLDADDEPAPRPRKRRVIADDDDDDDNDANVSNKRDDGDYVPPQSPMEEDYPPSPPKSKRKARSFDEDEEAEDLVMDDVPKSTPIAHFDFTTLTCPARTESSEDTQPMETETLIPKELSKVRIQAREKLAGISDRRIKKKGHDERTWAEKAPWTVDIRDANKRKPSDPDYDKSTLYIPPGVLVDKKSSKGEGLTPFQRQFWKIKKDNYDIIIFFKKGKFYELYDRDADTGHKELNLTYTRGGRVDMRCCGVPEQSFNRHCGRLLEMGYKIGRVEQTESATALEMRKSGGLNGGAAVCERTLVRILTKGTASEDGLLKDHRARYVFAIIEDVDSQPNPDSDKNRTVKNDKYSTDSACTTIGICCVDVASGSISISQFEDDYRLSKVERLIACMRPLEVLVDFSVSSSCLKNLLTWYSRQSGAEVSDFAKKDGFPIMTKSWLGRYMKDKDNEPRAQDAFKRVCSYMGKFEISSRAFGAMAKYLKSLIIDEEIMSLGNYKLFPDVGNEDGDTVTTGTASDMLHLSGHVRMDAPTLQNLEILTSSLDGTEKGSLLSFVDRAATAPGRRLIRKWLTEPLQSSFDIEERLNAIDAIHEIEDMDGGRTLQNILSRFRTKRDLERALPKLHRHATVYDGAVMFDDTNKRRVKEFVAVLKGLRTSINAAGQLKKALADVQHKSRRLDWLCSEGAGIPKEAPEKLSFFLEDAFDVKQAEENGEILPKDGAVPAYDDARKSVESIDEDLSEELRMWKRKLKDKNIQYVHRGKEIYQVEVKNQTLRGGVPDEFELTSETKTCKRFYTPEIKRLVRLQTHAKEVLDEAACDVVREIVRNFDKEYRLWNAVIATCAEIDALIGLSAASRDNGSGPMCRPKILPNDHPRPFFKAEQLRHPILSANSDNFVSNDISLGADGKPEVMVLTGPNAGGKSTLARQIAVAVILAQIGCYVPAKSCEFRPFKDIYVRMGACDDIARGRSTFMVEMEEVGSILNCSTPYSLVIADEVGRGTSTHDGFAVAYAALDHITRVNRALTVFSTHYSHLADDLVRLERSETRSSVGLYEMAARVDEATKKITFLYKVQPGSSGHSRGIYCARVAGIPSKTADEAEEASATFDKDLERRLVANSFLNIAKALQNPSLNIEDIRNLV